MSLARAVSSVIIEPMYASVGADLPRGQNWTFEPKYDGVRVLAHVSRRAVQLVTRNGNDKARQFPEIATALAALAARTGRSFILDGEIVALVNGESGRFQALQGRMHLKGSDEIADQSIEAPAAIVAFDLLRDGTTWLVDLPWTERRARLEALLDGLARTKRARKNDDVAMFVRLAPTTRGRGDVMLARARAQGWEGIIAKRTDARYVPGERSDAWRKLKLDNEAEFVIGGFTEPRKSREHIGAILLGYFDDAGRLIYAGHTGGGFTRAALGELHARLIRLVRKTSPFAVTPRTNEPATWVRPSVVVQVKFSEWTADGRLRQPIFLGVRDDKNARDVTRETKSLQ